MDDFDLENYLDESLQEIKIDLLTAKEWFYQNNDFLISIRDFEKNHIIKLLNKLIF